MTLGERIEARRKAVGIKSQSELARQAEIGQSTLNGLIRNPYRWSPHLTKIARALQTTVEFLTGEIDDPDAGAPPPSPAAPQVVMLGVVLPPERALARMFEALLAGMPDGADRDEQALLLARRLPTGLAQLRDLLPETVQATRRPARSPAPALATPEPGQPA